MPRRAPDRGSGRVWTHQSDQRSINSQFPSWSPIGQNQRAGEHWLLNRMAPGGAFPSHIPVQPPYPEESSLFQSKNEPEGSCGRGQLQTSPFRDFFIYISWLSWRWECGNRFYRFPRFVGRAENSIIVFRAFHKPSFPRSTSTAALVSGRSSYLLEHGGFGLLHASRGVGVAHGCGHAFERREAESGAQELLRPIE